MENEFLKISVGNWSQDFSLFRDIINQGIDAHLEAFTKSKFKMKDAPPFGQRLDMEFHQDEKKILLRRLDEIGSDEASQWLEDILGLDNE